MDIVGKDAGGLHTDVAAFEELLDPKLWAWDESALPEGIVGWEVGGEGLDG